MSTRAHGQAGLDARTGAALLASLCAHLLALLAWRQAPPPRPIAAPRVLSILLPAPVRTPARAPRAADDAAAHPADARPAPAPAAHAARTTPAAGAAASAPAPVPAAPAATGAARIIALDPAHASAADDAAAPAPAEAPSAAAAVAASSANAPPAASAGDFDIGLARRQAGPIDRELRGGKSGVPLEADTPWARFRRNAEGARANGSMSVYEDATTGPDGVIVYRYRQGKGARCRRSGSVGLGIAGAAGINDAGWINCPKGADWQPLE